MEDSEKFDEFYEFDEFEKLVKPISEFIRKKYDMHTTVIITETTAKVVRDDIGMPIKND